MKAALALVMMIGFMRIQIYLKPYKIDAFSKLEQREFYASIFTIYSSIIF